MYKISHREKKKISPKKPGVGCNVVVECWHMCKIINLSDSNYQVGSSESWSRDKLGNTSQHLLRPDNYNRQLTSLSASVSSSRRSVTSVRQNTQISASISENPPEAPKGSAKPPRSYNNPPIVGPKREPTPLKDSANDVALPFTHQHVIPFTVYCVLSVPG